MIPLFRTVPSGVSDKQIEEEKAIARLLVDLGFISKTKGQLLEEEYIEKMKGCTQGVDVELDHAEADKILCDFLRSLGYSAIVDVYNRVYKSY